MQTLVKYHGGKWYLKHWIISNFPVGYEQMTYIEPYCGGFSVGLNKHASYLDIASDLNKCLIDLWIAVQSAPDYLVNELSKLFYTEKTLQKAIRHEFPSAINEYVLRRMSRGGLGKDFAYSERLRGGMPGDENSWYRSIENIEKISQKIQKVRFFNVNAIDIIQNNNKANTFIYIDPPYVKSTRTAKSIYNFEMLDSDHLILLDILKTFKGKILLSGYDSNLYNNCLLGWNKVFKTVANHSGQNRKKQKRTEILWRNY